MSKPIVVQQVGKMWVVTVDMAAARAFGARGKRVREHPDALYVVTKKGNAVDMAERGTPGKFTKSDADHVAHKIGRYVLDLGDFAYTYVEVRRESSGDRHRDTRRGRTRVVEFRVIGAKRLGWVRGRVESESWDEGVRELVARRFPRGYVVRDENYGGLALYKQTSPNGLTRVGSIAPG